MEDVRTFRLFPEWLPVSLDIAIEPRRFPNLLHS